MSTIGSTGSTGTVTPPATPTPSPTTPTTPTAAAVSLRSERFTSDAVLKQVADGTRTLERGARGDAVKRVQLALQEAGYSFGRYGADGDYGATTASVVAQFQRASGLTASGIVDRSTLAALDAKVYAVDHPAPRPTDAARLDTPRFSADPVFQAVLAGTRTIARGARGPEVEKLQWTLLGLGHDVGPARADGSFGGGTESALRAFQQKVGLAQSGRLDGATLKKLDDAAAAKLEELKALSPAPEEKALKYRVVADLERCRVYVLEKGSDKPVAAYLTSPGTADHPTLGDRFTLQNTAVWQAWVPPSSPWAAGLQPVPPGVDNPMGIVKLNFGAYAQFLHGCPKSAEANLGRPASHGCLRLSGTNILEFKERYAGPGTDVRINRDRAESARLAQAFATAGVTDRPILAGVEYMAPYLASEMGFNERREANGSIRVGGRG